jgi:hypothetical protein
MNSGASNSKNSMTMAPVVASSLAPTEDAKSHKEELNVSSPTAAGVVDASVHTNDSMALAPAQALVNLVAPKEDIKSTRRRK